MRERMLGPAAENQLLVLINRRSRSNWRAMLRILRKVIQRYVPGHFMSNLSDGCVKSRQTERLEKHRCMHPPKEKIEARVVLMAGKKDKSLPRSGPDASHGPIKHLSAHIRHHHIANDELKTAFHYFAQPLDAALD